MEFNQALSILFTWQFMLLSFSTAALILAIRRPVEAAWPRLAENAIWKSVALNTMPLVVGTLLSLLLSTVTLPAGITTGGGRVLFGITAGACSSFLWQLAKPFLLKKAGVEVDKVE